jgi:hypothetical protein
LLFLDFFCHGCNREVTSEEFDGDDIQLEVVGEYGSVQGNFSSTRPYYEVELSVEAVCEKCDNIQLVRLGKDSLYIT